MRSLSRGQRGYGRGRAPSLRFRVIARAPESKRWRFSTQRACRMNRASHVQKTPASSTSENARCAAARACQAHAMDRRAAADGRQVLAIPPPTCWLAGRHRNVHRARFEKDASRESSRSARANLRDPARRRRGEADHVRDLADTGDRNVSPRSRGRKMHLLKRPAEAHCDSIQRRE